MNWFSKIRVFAVFAAVICQVGWTEPPAAFSISCVGMLRHLYARSFEQTPQIPALVYEGPGVEAVAYEHYMKHRVAQFSEGSPAVARFRSAHQIFDSSLGEELNGVVRYPSEWSDQTRVIVLLPERYRGTVIEQMIRIHENEHLLSGWDDNSTLSEALDSKAPNVGKLIDQLRGKVAVERAAIRAEWEYLRLLPEAIKAETMSALEADPLVSNEAKQVYRHALGGSSEPFENFYYKQARLRLYDSASRTHHALRLLTDGVVGRRLYESYRDMPKERQRLLQQRVAQDTVLAASDRQSILAKLKDFDSMYDYQPTVSERLAMHAKDVQNENVVNFEKWVRGGGPIPSKMVHRDLWGQLFEPTLEQGELKLNAMPEGYPGELVIVGVTDLLVLNPSVGKMRVAKRLFVDDHFKSVLIQNMTRLGFSHADDGSDVVFSFEVARLPPWNHRYYAPALSGN